MFTQCAGFSTLQTGGMTYLQYYHFYTWIRHMYWNFVKRNAFAYRLSNGLHYRTCEGLQLLKSLFYLSVLKELQYVHTTYFLTLNEQVRKTAFKNVLNLLYTSFHFQAKECTTVSFVVRLCANITMNPYYSE